MMPLIDILQNVYLRYIRIKEKNDNKNKTFFTFPFCPLFPQFSPTIQFRPTCYFAHLLRKDAKYIKIVLETLEETQRCILIAYCCNAVFKHRKHCFK